MLSIAKIPKQEIVFPNVTKSTTDDGTMFTLPEKALNSIAGATFYYEFNIGKVGNLNSCILID